MSVEILDTNEYQVLLDTTTMQVFGSVFYINEDAFDFLEWLEVDANSLSKEDLDIKINEWRTQ